MDITIKFVQNLVIRIKFKYIINTLHNTGLKIKNPQRNFDF